MEAEYFWKDANTWEGPELGGNPGGCLTLPVRGLPVAMGPTPDPERGSCLGPTRGFLFQADPPSLAFFFWAFHTTPHPALLISFPSPSLGSPEGWTLPENSACTSGVRTREPQMWKLRPLSDMIPGCCLTARAHRQVVKSCPWSGSLCLPLFSCPAATQPALPYSPPLLCSGVSPNFPGNLAKLSASFWSPCPGTALPAAGWPHVFPRPPPGPPSSPRLRPTLLGLTSLAARPEPSLSIPPSAAPPPSCRLTLTQAGTLAPHPARARWPQKT